MPVLFFSFIFFSLDAYADGVTCTASVSPNESQPNVDEKYFAFTVTNTGSSDINWFKITLPISGITLGPVSLANWEKSFPGDGVVFKKNQQSMSTNQTLSPSVGTYISDIPGQSGNWSVQASNDIAGANPVSCSGSLGLSITGTAPDTTAPEISGLTVSNINATSAMYTGPVN